MTVVTLEPVAGFIAGFVTVSPTIDVADGGGSCAKEIAADASSAARKVKRKELSIGSKRIILTKCYQAALLF